MAKCIAQKASKEAVVFPKSLKDILDRMIKARIGFDAKLAKWGIQVTAKARKRHKYFNSQLAKVREILEPHLPKERLADAVSQNSINNMPNRFQNLPIYEPSDEVLDAPGMERPTNTEGDKTTYKLETPAEWDDAISMLEIEDLIGDLGKIGDEVDQIWKQYKSGQIHLVSAAIATNTAVDLVKTRMEKIAAKSEKHGGIFKLLMSRTTEAPTSDQESDDIIIIMKDLLRIFRMINEISNSNSNKSGESMDKKYEQDKVLLRALFDELNANASDRQYQLHDELLRGIDEIGKTGTTPFYVVFASQLYLSIHHILRQCDCTGQLDNHTRFLIAEPEIASSFHHGLKHLWSVAETQNIYELVQKMNNLRASMGYKVDGQESGTTAKRTEIFKYSPVLCGLLIYRYSAEVRDVGLKLMDAFGHVMASVHLSNAFEVKERLKNPWHDVKLVKTLLRDTSFFPGSAPTRKQDFLIRFAIQVGVSAASPALRARVRGHSVSLARKGLRKFKANQVPGHSVSRSRKGPRKIKADQTASMYNMFKDRYCRDNTDQINWTSQHIDQIMKHAKFLAEANEKEEKSTACQTDDDQDKLRGKRGSGSGKKKSREKKRTDKKTEERLGCLATALDRETEQLIFPWLTIERACWKLLRQITEHCAELVKRKFPTQYFSALVQNHDSLPGICICIFLDEEICKKAVAKTNEFIAAEGDTALNALKGLIGSRDVKH